MADVVETTTNDSESSGITNSSNFMNGDINGLCKSSNQDEQMIEEDDSQISSENGLSEVSDSVSLKKDTLANKISNSDSEKSNSNKDINSTSLKENSEDKLFDSKEQDSQNSKKQDSQNSEKQDSNDSTENEDNEDKKIRIIEEKESQLTNQHSDDSKSEEAIDNIESKSNLEKPVDEMEVIEEYEIKAAENKNDEKHVTPTKISELDDDVKTDEKMDVDSLQESASEENTENIKNPTVAENSADSNEFQKANGEISNELKGPASDNEVQVIDSDDDEDPFKDIPNQSDVDLSKDFKSRNGNTSKLDEDGSVVIQSDSDNDEKSNENVKTIVNNDDDDDDDCVVIDDDDDQPNAKAEDSGDSSKRTSTRQRKSAITVRSFADLENDDITEIIDDSQPPSKRQKTNPLNINLPIGASQIGKLTIKDARSLCDPSTPKSYQQSFLQSAGVSPSAAAQLSTIKQQSNVYPIGLTTTVQLPQTNQLPKLIPVSNAALAPPVIGINPNLLPALTDDMYVLEAPSFIVPYIYEKPPETNLKEIIAKMVTEFNLRDKPEVESKNHELDELEKLKPKESNLEDNQDENKKEDTTKKSKKRRKNKNGDESWGESDESQDEDDSGDEERTKVLIKNADTDINTIKAVIAPAEKIISSSPPSNENEKKSENYFESPLGKFFIDIGVNLVQEYVQADLLRIQKRKLRKQTGGNEAVGTEVAIAALTKNLETSKKRNGQFRFDLKRCEFCNFKTESALSMAHHYETPHMEKNMYKCNFCTFEVRQTQEILFHMEAVHNIKGRLEKPLSYHQCPNCPFEDNGKSKIARHQPVCIKKFRPEVNLCPPNDWEAPAKIPRIKPRHGLVGTATAYQAMAAQAAAQKAALATLQQQQQAARNLLTANANNSNKNRRAQAVKIAPARNVPNPLAARSGTVSMQPIRQQLSQGVVLPNPYNLTQGGPGGLIQNQNAKRSSGGQPSISITPLPRQVQASSPQTAQISTGGNPKPGIKPGQSGNKSSFVICEICDGYIKDLDQLRNHMQWMHKVKIHPKMIYNRPPLNCQKCQFRFFTDQGLERHLLGSHGLVTSSMQDAANKGKDAGRCPVCGRVYQWKLLNHVSRDHNMTLKPAHLSYKCTVCTATFGMYKEFENHVYTAHSTVAKKAMDVKKGNGNTITQQRSTGNTAANNDSLLRPLRINDEITIIPQPATKKV